MKTMVKSGSLVIGTFDDDKNLDRATGHLAPEGFEYRVLDQTTVSDAAGDSGPAPISPLLVAGTPAVQAPEKYDISQAARLLRSQLMEFDLPEMEIETYAREFERNAKFILIAPEPERITRAMDILRECQASKVSRHD